MTGNDNEPDIQDSGTSNEPEKAIQTPIPTEDKTLLQCPDALTNEAIDEPTRKFAAPAGKFQINDEIEFEAAPTKILRVESQNDEADEPPVEPDENALRPNRLRSALVWLLLAAAAGWMMLNFGLISHQQSERGWRYFYSGRADEFYKVIYVHPSAADKLQAGDELIRFDGARFDRDKIRKIEFDLKPGDRYTLEVRRGEGEPFAVELAAQPLRLVNLTTNYFISLIIPAVLLVVFTTIFLLKPNDKAVILLTIFNAFVSVAIVPLALAALELSPPLFVFYVIFKGLSMSCTAVLLHFFLIFPEPLPVVRRHPAIKRLLYAPWLIFILMPWTVDALLSLNQPRFVIFDNLFFFTGITYFAQGLFLLAALTALTFGYFRAGETNKRRLRLIAVGSALTVIPIALHLTIFQPLGWLYHEWQPVVVLSPAIIMPFVWAYAIARHKVIPVSLIIRRSLQYILAKNALRRLLILPVAGIVWNVAANPQRTLVEILFQNSFWFYFFVAVAVVDGLLMRLHLNEWIDKKFFREQYNQEKVLRELAGAVAESDSLPKLSRLVSSKIQSALHSENVYLFFRDDQMNSDFSLGYAASGTSSGASGNLKLAADSPILRFMQRHREAVDFPFKEKDDLPNRESVWLRSISANLLVPMHGTDGRLAGFFSLGEKKSEIPYTGRDKELLETLAHQIALVHENLGLKDRVRREQRIKTEVLSRFDEGNVNLLKECPACGKCYDRRTEKCADDEAELTFTLPVERTIENRYRLERLLGKGGMGAVYEAADTRINRRIAVKILSGATFGNRDALRRFEREAQTAGRLSHPNIVTVHDYGSLSTEGAFLVMELVEGENLRRVLDRAGKLDREVVVRWFSQILDGVQSAHEQGVIHRDLKPDNIFLTRDEKTAERLSILDFGLARLSESAMSAAPAANVTVPGMIMGTPGYMPPEQLRGERTDERSDLFAVGVMIYEALYGAKPFAGKNYLELLQLMTKELSFEELNQPAREFFRRSLAPEPERRFTSASEMRSALEMLTS